MGCHEAIELSQVAAFSHAIKGASGNLGIERVHRLAAEIEAVARGRAEGSIRDTVVLLESAMNEAKDCIEKYLTRFGVSSDEGPPETGDES